jgi:ABC-type lipoprotein release transport system permease subunit
MIAEIAWKNVWRNKTRSLIVIAAVAIGVFAGVFSIAAINSSVEQRIDAAVNEELSDIQINNKDFRSSGDIQNIIKDFPKIKAVLDSTPGVKSYTGRIIVRGIASTAAKSTGVEITGIDTDKEKEIFTLSQKLIPGTGSYFETTTKYNMAYIGEKLAKELNIIRYILGDDAVKNLEEQGVPAGVIRKLEPLKDIRYISEKEFSQAFEPLLTKTEKKKYGLKIKEAAWSYREGSRMVLTFLDVNDDQTGAVFRITGIFRTNNDMFEASSVFVPVEELRRLTGMKEDTYHRIIVKLDKTDLTDKVTAELRSALPGFEVLSWKEIQPDLAMILAALAFGIVNTMLMSVLERTRELGMLAAIGMNHRKTFMMIMLESVFLSFVGGIAGMGLGAAVIALTAKHGINLVKYSEGMQAFGYSAHLFPTIDPEFFFITSLLIILTGILASIYPARKALKLNPVDALRGE